MHLWIVELLCQGGSNHGQQVPASTAALQAPAWPCQSAPSPNLGLTRPPGRRSAQLSPAPPGSSPAGCCLLCDVRGHTGVPTHRQGQPGPEAPDPAQPFTQLPHLVCRESRWSCSSCPLTHPTPPRGLSLTHHSGQHACRCCRQLLLCPCCPESARIFHWCWGSAGTGHCLWGDPTFLKHLRHRNTSTQ